MIDCYSCKEKNKLRQGMDYAASPCAKCRLAKDIPHENAQYISSAPESEKLISFFERTRFVMRHSARRKMLYALLNNPRITDKQLADCFRLSRRKVSYHVRVIKKSIPEIFGVRYANQIK